MASSHRARLRRRRPGPRGPTNTLSEDRVEDQLLGRRPPLQQREVGPGMLERPGLLDHPELVGAGVRLHRDPAGLVQDHHEQRRRGEHVRGPDDLPGRGPDRGGQRVRQVGRRSAAPTVNTTNSTTGSVIAANVLARLAPSWAYGLPVSSAATATQEAGQRQDEPAAEDVAHVAQRQRVARQHRDQQRHRQVAGERGERRGQEDPARPLRRQRLLAEQLGQVVVRLQHPRAPAALQPRLDPARSRRIRLAPRPRSSATWRTWMTGIGSDTVMTRPGASWRGGMNPPDHCRAAPAGRRP